MQDSNESEMIRHFATCWQCCPCQVVFNTKDKCIEHFLLEHVKQVEQCRKCGEIIHKDNTFCCCRCEFNISELERTQRRQGCPRKAKSRTLSYYDEVEDPLVFEDVVDHNAEVSTANMPVFGLGDVKQKRKNSSTAKRLCEMCGCRAGDEHMEVFHCSTDRLDLLQPLSDAGQLSVKCPADNCQLDKGFTVQPNETPKEVIVRHHLEVYCHKCQLQFVSKTFLKRHMKQEHSTSRALCPHCGKVFTDNIYLKEHMFKVHTSQASDVPKRFTSFKCDECGKVLSDKKGWRRHQETHRPLSERKRGLCSHCGKVFYSTTAAGVRRRLAQHTNFTHTTVPDGQLVRCDECGRMFNTVSQLKQHTTLHTGVKPFGCPLCSYRSNQRGNVRLHLRAHHASHTSAQPVTVDTSSVAALTTTSSSHVNVVPRRRRSAAATSSARTRHGDGIRAGHGLENPTSTAGSGGGGGGGGGSGSYVTGVYHSVAPTLVYHHPVLHRSVHLPHTAPHLTTPHFTTPHLTTPHFTTPHLTTPHLTTAHLTTSQHFISHYNNSGVTLPD